jgi:hypothetical protein
MAFTIRTPLVGAQGIHTAETVQRHPLGTEVQAWDPVFGEGTFVYAKSTATSTNIGDWVVFLPDSWEVIRAIPDSIGAVGVSMLVHAANSYVWYQISGKCVAKAAAGFVDNANVYLTATAGVVDDAVVAGDRVKLAKGASAVGTLAGADGTSITSAAEFEIHRPFVDDGLAA